MLPQLDKGPVCIAGASPGPGPGVLTQRVVSDLRLFYPSASPLKAYISLKLGAGLAGGSRCAPLREPLCGHCFPPCGSGWILVAHMVGTPLVLCA